MCRLDGSKLRCVSAGLENGGIVLCFRRKHLFFNLCKYTPYTQNNQKHDLSKQQSKQAKTGEVELNYKMFADPVFINPGRFIYSDIVFNYLYLFVTEISRAKHAQRSTMGKKI